MDRDNAGLISDVIPIAGMQNSVRYEATGVTVVMNSNQACNLGSTPIDPEGIQCHSCIGPGCFPLVQVNYSLLGGVTTVHHACTIDGGCWVGLQVESRPSVLCLHLIFVERRYVVVRLSPHAFEGDDE